MNDPTNAERKRRLRQKRAKDGLTEVRVWLNEEEVSDLAVVERLEGFSRRQALTFCVWAGREEAEKRERIGSL